MVNEHPILLRGLGLAAPGGAPTIAARSDADFIEAILAELQTAAGRAKLARTVVAPTSGALHLFQPVQRVFHVALFEVACDPFGAEGLRPRLDPRKLRGAGMVVRRVGDSPSIAEGWRDAEGVIRGWVSFAGADDAADPAPSPALPRAPQRRR